MTSPASPLIIKGNRRRCLIIFVLLGGLVLSLNHWFLPWLKDFSARSVCIEIAGINGTVLLLASLFIGITFSVFIVTLWIAWYALRILSSGQSPPPDTWLCRDTVPVTGKKAKVRAYVGLAAPLLGLAFLCWGIFTFYDFKHRVIDPGLEKAKASCLSLNNQSAQQQRQ